VLIGRGRKKRLYRWLSSRMLGAGRHVTDGRAGRRAFLLAGRGHRPGRQRGVQPGDAQGQEIVKKRDKVEQDSARERNGSGGTFCPLEQKWNRWVMANLDGGS
jgi:hypothetical protein